jgi:hypothetical protein
MNPLKLVIFSEVKKTNTDLEVLSDEELNQLLFHHPSGLRLSLTGFRVLRKVFSAYSFELPKTIKSRHHYNMGKLEFPYYFTNNRIILFSEMDAVIVKLHGGVESFLEVYSNQDE